MSSLRSALSRLSSKDAGPDFELERFECVLADDTLALARLSGRWGAPRRQELPDVRLVMTIAGVPLPIPPLPTPGSETLVAVPRGTPWQAGFRVATEVIESTSTEFALDPGDGSLIPLPRPLVQGTPARRPAVEPEPAPELEPEPAPELEPEPAPELEPEVGAPSDHDELPQHEREGQDARVAALERHVRDLEARLEEGADLRRRDRELAEALAAVRGDRDRLEADLRSALDERVAVGARLEAALERMEGALEEAARLEAALADSTTRTTELEARVEQQAAELRARVSERGTDEVDTEVRELEGRLAIEREAKATAERRLAELDAAHAKAQSEVRRARDRAAELQAALDGAQVERGQVEAELAEVRRQLLEAREAVARAEAETHGRLEALEGNLRDGVAKEAALRDQLVAHGSATADRVELMEAELEARISAEHELRAKLELQDTELKAARAAADSRARELKEAERRIAAVSLSSGGTASAPPREDGREGEDAEGANRHGEVLARVYAAKDAAATVEG